jgi:hypothetical protein
LRDQNGEIYIWGHHKNVGDSEFLEHIASAKELAEIMFDVKEQQILEFDTGHWAVCLPEEIREELQISAYYSREKSRQEMIVERLRRSALTDEQKGALVRARSPQPSAAHQTQVPSLVEKIPQRQAAAKESNVENDLTFEERNGEVACDGVKDPRDAAAAGYEEKISEVTA